MKVLIDFRWEFSELLPLHSFYLYSVDNNDDEFWTQDLIKGHHFSGHLLFFIVSQPLFAECRYSMIV